MRGNAEAGEQRTPSQPPHALDVWSGAPLFVTDGVDDQHLMAAPDRAARRAPHGYPPSRAPAREDSRVPHMTAEEAADCLGIADEHLSAFVAIVDALRTPDARRAEIERLRAELEAVDEVLREAGIDHPTGALGVHDLHSMRDIAREDADEDARAARIVAALRRTRNSLPAEVLAALDEYDAAST